MDLGPIAHLYEQSLSRHGHSPTGVGWKTEASQRLRFDKLLTLLAERGQPEPVEINDLGCGYACAVRIPRQ